MKPDAHTARPAIADEISGEVLLRPPGASRELVEHVLHGDRRVDHYAWLRHQGNPEVIAYSEFANDFS